MIKIENNVSVKKKKKITWKETKEERKVVWNMEKEIRKKKNREKHETKENNLFVLISFSLLSLSIFIRKGVKKILKN